MPAFTAGNLFVPCDGQLLSQAAKRNPSAQRTIPMRTTASLLLAVCLALMVGCASQEDVITLNDRISIYKKGTDENQSRLSRAEQRLNTMESAQEQMTSDTSEENRNLRRQGAELRAALETLKTEIQAMRGRLDESEYRLKKQIQGGESAEQEPPVATGRLAEIENRLARIEQFLNLEVKSDKSAPATPAAKTPAKQPAKALSADALYQQAKEAFDRDDYEEALKGFQKFITRYPKSNSADNAQFWIGEIYYREKWYEKAILEYQKVIENYPKGNKVQASLLKQGFAFFKIGDKANGRLILKELIKKYPKSKEAKIAKKSLQKS